VPCEKNAGDVQPMARDSDPIKPEAGRGLLVLARETEPPEPQGLPQGHANDNAGVTVTSGRRRQSPPRHTSKGKRMMRREATIAVETPVSNGNDLTDFSDASDMNLLEAHSDLDELTEPLILRHPRSAHFHDTEARASKTFNWDQKLGKKRRSSSDDDSNMGRSMFPSSEDVKNRVLQALEKPEYNVEDLYKEHGRSPAIAKNSYFKNATLLVIFINTIWIAIETDNNKADVLCNADWAFIVIDNFFCTFFVFEILVRFFSFRRKCQAVTDGWFVFDLFLVALMVWETWISVALYIVMGGDVGMGSSATSIFRIFRLFRLTRVARLARLLRSMPELMILIKGMLMAMRSVFATLCLLVIIIYVFAIFFTQLLSDTEVGKGCFENVPQAMNCLLLNGVFSEEKEFISKMLYADWIYYVFILVYLLLASLTVMNMLIGVLCEVVSVVAKIENEEIQTKDLKTKIMQMMPHVTEEGDMVCKHSFNKLLESPDAIHSLQNVGVDVVALVDLSDFIFRDQTQISVKEFIKTVLQFRGSNLATVKDLVDIRTFFSEQLSTIQDYMSNAVRQKDV